MSAENSIFTNEHGYWIRYAFYEQNSGDVYTPACRRLISPYIVIFIVVVVMEIRLCESRNRSSNSKNKLMKQRRAAFYP